MRQVKGVLGVSLCLLIISIATVQSQAPKRQVKTVEAGDNVMLIPGLGALLKEDAGKLHVDFVMAPKQRTEEYREVDLKQGDQVIMCNGKRLTEMNDLRAIIDSLAVGETIKLGIKRDQDMMIASFAKADPSAMGGHMMVVEGQDAGGPKVKKHLSFDGPGGAEGTVAVLDGGLVIAPKGDGLFVLGVMPMAREKISGDMPQEGDRIVSVNGELDTNIDAFNELYDKIPDGTKIEVRFTRDGEELMATYTKSSMKNGGKKMMMGGDK